MERIVYKAEENQKLFPQFIEAKRIIKEELIKKYPYLVLKNLKNKHRSGELKEDKQRLDKGDIIVGKEEKISSALQESNLADYGFLYALLIKLNAQLADDKNKRVGIFRGIDLEVLGEDINGWLKELKRIKPLRDRLVENNLKLVIKIVDEIILMNGISRVDRENMIGDGIKGLLYAVDNFNVSRGSGKFATYASYPIKGAIYSGIGELYGSSKIAKRAKKYVSNEAIFKKQNGRKPSRQEMAEMLNVNPKYIEEIRLFITSQASTFSLNQPIGDSEEDFLEYLSNTKFMPEKLTIRKEREEMLKKIIGKVFKNDPRRKDIILRRFFEEDTLQNIADQYKISRERARQLEADAIKKLRNETFKMELKFNDFI